MLGAGKGSAEKPKRAASGGSSAKKGVGRKDEVWGEDESVAATSRFELAMEEITAKEQSLEENFNFSGAGRVKRRRRGRATFKGAEEAESAKGEERSTLSGADFKDYRDLDSLSVVTGASGAAAMDTTGSGARINSMCAKLDERGKARLEELMNNIETQFGGADEERILAIRDKADDEKSELLSAIVPYEANAFDYAGEESRRLQDINESLKGFVHALPAPEGESDTLSIAGGPSLAGKSVAGGIGARSGVVSLAGPSFAGGMGKTGASFMSGKSGGVLSRIAEPAVLPKEKALREKAEERNIRDKMREIDSELYKMR